MTELLTAAQMRAIEKAAIASGAVTGLELMERAGRGVVSAIFAEWPELAPSWGPTPKPPEYLLQDDEKGKHRAVVLCGPGNNGGDGFVVARLLFEAGWEVEVFLYGDAEKLPPDARVNYERWAEAGAVNPYDTLQLWSAVRQRQSGQHVVLVEALFGSGQTQRAGSALLGLVIDIDEAVTYHRNIDAKEHDVKYHTVSVDTPVNASADTGIADGWIASYDLLVTFHANKGGHVLADIPKNVANTVVVDIGL